MNEEEQKALDYHEAHKRKREAIESRADRMKFKKYTRKNIAEIRYFISGETLDKKVSISQADSENGSPQYGDMIARNPMNNEDQWLIAEDYFIENFELKEDED